MHEGAGVREREPERVEGGPESSQSAEVSHFVFGLEGVRIRLGLQIHRCRHRWRWLRCARRVQLWRERKSVSE